MNKNAIASVRHGPVGDPVYDQKNCDWRFTRRFGSENLGSVLYSDIALAAEQTGEFGNNSVFRETRVDVLGTRRSVLEEPDLAAARDCVDTFAKESDTVNRASESFDPASGQSFAIGTARSLDAFRRKGPIELAAITSGQDRTSIRIFALENDRLNVEGAEVGQAVSSTIGREITRYEGSDAAICQICFSSPDFQRLFLAVRYSTQVLIFRLSSSKSTVSSDNEDVRIDCSPSMKLLLVAAVSAKAMGQIPYADVSFNPWNPRQYAVVDENGSWAMWEMTSRLMSSKQAYCSTLKCKEALKSHTQQCSRRELSVKESVLEDGWCRILWLANFNTIFVCNRRAASIWDVSFTPVELECPSFVDMQSSNWILDAQRDPQNLDHLFILTSTTLFITKLIPAEGNGPGNPTTVQLSVLNSWQHYLNGEDITLGMSCSSSPSGSAVSQSPGTVLLIYSRTNQIILSLWFEFNRYDPSRLLSLSDPRTVDIFAATGFGSDTQSKVVDIKLRRLPNIMRGPQSIGANGIDYFASQNIFELFVMFADRSIQRHIFGTHTYSRSSVERYATLRIKHSPRQTSRPSWFPSAKFIKEPPFVCSDEELDLPPESKINTERIVFHRYGTRRRRQTTKDSDDNAGISLVELYNSRIKVRAIRCDDIVTYLQESEAYGAVEADTGFAFKHSLYERKVHETSIEDIQSFDEYLQLIGGLEGFQSLQYQLTNHDSFGTWTSETDKDVLLGLYDSSLDCWTKPLSETYPSEGRKPKEREVRMAISDLCLSSLRIKHPGELPNSSNDLREGRKMTFPIRISQSTGTVSELDGYGQGTGLKASQDLAGSLPGSFPSSGPSISLSLPNTPLHESSSNKKISCIYERLKQYVDINTSPESDGSSTDKFLSHWEVGANPSTYDWESSNRLYEEANGRDHGIIDIAHRSKAIRRAEKFARRQKREDALATSQQPYKRFLAVATSPPPTVAPSSQIFQGSSQGGFTSQVEPGRYGGRPPKKKKIRQSGF